jgi:hypothetical protein
MSAINDQAYAAIGTSGAIFVPSPFSSAPVQVGVDYFAVRIVGAQVAFVGNIWSKARSILVSTQVNLHHSFIGERGLRSLQQSRPVSPRVDEQLGLATNLVDLTPAVMPRVTVSIEFHLDKENRIARLGSLVNKESFSAALSLAPGGVLVAKTISALANDIIQTFIPAEEQEPILQFTGDFNLSTGEISPGYYVILGSRDPDHPIPSPLPDLEVRDHRLMAGGRPVSGLSYVILEVRKTPARTRDLGGGTDWDMRLREAEDVAQALLDDPLADEVTRKDGWTKCLNLLKEAQTLLRADPSYLRAETERITKAAYLRCRELVAEPVRERGRAGPLAAAAWMPDTRVDQQVLGVTTDGELERDAMAYADDVMRTRRTLAGWRRG